MAHAVGLRHESRLDPPYGCLLPLDSSRRSSHNECRGVQSTAWAGRRDDAFAHERSPWLMISPRFRVPTALALLMGVFLGWGLSSFRPVPLRASAGDRSGEAIVATGPILMQYDETAKAVIPLEALYFLDYKGGRLLGTV